MSVVDDILTITTTKGKRKIMKAKTYQVGDLFTTAQSKVTGTIKEIIPVNANTTTLLLDVNGEDRYTSVKF